jgi:hypothetical protein
MFPAEELVDLQRRIAAPRWPDRETVTDQSQGVQLATMKELARYWSSDHDFGGLEGNTERHAEFHHRDRWAARSFHSCSLEA